jgi:hypothetical protein
MILAMMLWRSVFAAMHRKEIHRETGLRPHHGNALQRRFRALEAGSQEMRLSDRSRRAKTYLRRIAALTGATQTDEAYVLDVGKTRFYVRDRYVRRLRDATNPESGYDETCFYCSNKTMPRAEETASALLQLKNNPRLFDQWAKQHGLAFKADGEVFTRTK